MAEKTETELLRCEDCAPEFACWEYVHARCRKRADEAAAIEEINSPSAKRIAELERENKRLADKAASLRLLLAKHGIPVTD